MSAAMADGVDELRQRRAVVLHADVVDYSRLMADDAAATVATMRTYHELVAATVGESGGTLVNFVGDSFLAVFDDARSAMRAAMAICGAVRDHNAQVPRSRRAWFRLGLDAGEIVTAADGRHFGDPLNIAARIQALAEVGGVNVTQAVYTELDEPALRLVGVGPRRLKNIPEPVMVYRLAGVGARAVRTTPGAGSDPAVAVMPSNAADPDVRDIAEALRLEAATALGALPGLRVIDHGAPSVVGSPPDGDAAGDREIADADYCLELSVVRSGRRVRVYVTLTEVETINRVWGGRWEGATDDVFALQDAMAADLARAMEVELIVGQPAMIYRLQLDGRQRVTVYRAWHHLTDGTPDGWQRATELFESVVAGAPDIVSGHALSAFARWWGAVEGLSPDPDGDLERAREHAARGVELDDPSGLSQLVVAALALHAGDDLDAALADARASLALRPTCDVSYVVLGSVQRYLGDWKAAIDACRHAERISRLRMPWFATVQASAYYVGRHYHDAARLAEQVLEPQPGNREALLLLAASQQALGLTRRARATVTALLERFPATRCDQLAREHPFRDAEVLERWRGHLADAGVP